ncbi:MAG: hypothetical protein JEY96_00760 [Bacteroidales bacterium]|nr:hypothetical protein [Bacteroidales bacterium]
MNISFDKFFDFIKQWSAGRLAVLVLLIGELILKLKKDTHFLEPNLLFKLISMAILLEVLESVFGKMKPDGKGFWLYLLSIILSLGGIVVIALSMVFKF